MKNRKRWPALLMALLMLLSLCGCGSSGGGHSSAQYTASTAAEYYADAVYDDYESVAAEEAAALGGEFGLAPVPAPASAPAAQAKSDGNEPSVEKPDKIIYSSDVTVETTAFDETVAGISGLVESVGGWIESSSVSGSNYYQKARGTASTRDASYTLRIPSNRFNEVMDRLSELGNVPYSHIYTENVTSQYYDAQARLKAYETQEERLLEMMELAESVEDVITIEDRLTELRYRIESIQSSLNNWDRRVSYSTVHLSVKEVREYTPEEKVNPTYGEELLQALKDGIKNAGEVLKDLLMFLIELLPVLVVLVPFIWLAVWLIRKIIRASKARRGKRTERKAGKRARGRKTEAADSEALQPGENGNDRREPGHETPETESARKQKEEEKSEE